MDSGFQQPFQETLPLHRIAPASLSSLRSVIPISRLFIFIAPRRAITTISVLGRSSPRISRNQVRICRFIRLRPTAPATLRLTVIPSRTLVGPGARDELANRTKCRSAARLPQLEVHRNSRERRIRSARRKRPEVEAMTYFDGVLTASRLRPFARRRRRIARPPLVFIRARNP